MYVNECYEGRLRKTFIFSTRLLYLDTTVGPFLVLVHQSLSRRLVHQCKCPLTIVVGHMAGPGVVHEPLLHVVCVFSGHACIISKTYKKIDQLSKRAMRVPAFCRWGPRGQARSQSHEWTHTSCRRPCTVSSSPPWPVDRGASSSLLFRLRTLSTELPVARLEASRFLPRPFCIARSSPLALTGSLDYLSGQPYP